MKSAWLRTATAALVVTTAMAVTACGSSDKPKQSSSTAGVTGTITVFAASSLTESFTQIGKDFETANPGTRVTFNFGGSSALAASINQGAPADVFASASPTNMKQVTDAGNGTGTATVFVRNQLVIAVAKGNPKGITGPADLAKPDVKVALCDEKVPCGAASKKALDAAGVTLTPVTLEQDVKSVLAKLTLGDVDAALVYRTDTKANAGKVDGIEFAESAQAINDYPIIVLKGAPNAAGAQAFVDYVLSDKGKAVLTAAGFQEP